LLAYEGGRNRLCARIFAATARDGLVHGTPQNPEVDPPRARAAETTITLPREYQYPGRVCPRCESSKLPRCVTTPCETTRTFSLQYFARAAGKAGWAAFMEKKRR
jgi:hypothetical protein